MLDTNANKLVWMGVATGVVATLGLAGTQLYPEAFDAGKDQVVSLIAKFTGDDANGVALSDVKPSDIDFRKNQSYGVANLNNYLLQYGDAPEQVVDDKNDLLVFGLAGGFDFGGETDRSAANTNSEGDILNYHKWHLYEGNDDDGWGGQYKVSEIPGLSDVSKLSQNARIVTVGAIVDDAGNVLKVNQEQEYDSIADDKTYTAILVLVDNDANGNPRSEIVGYQFKGSDLKSKLDNYGFGVQKIMEFSLVGYMGDEFDGDTPYDGTYSGYKKAVASGALTYDEISQQDMDNYAKPLIVTYFTRGYAESADGIKDALAAFAAPDKKVTVDNPKGVIDVSKLDKNAAIDDLTVSKSLVVLNSKDFFKQPASASDSATIDQNKVYFENLAYTATAYHHQRGAILDGYTGEVSMPFDGRDSVAAVNYGDIAAISKLGPSAEVINVYAIDLDSGELLNDIRFSDEMIKDGHYYAVIVALQSASTAGTPSNAKFELVNLHLSGADVKKEFFNEDVARTTLAVVTNEVYGDDLHKGLTDNRPYEYGMISGAGFAFEKNHREPSSTLVADLKAHLRNLK